jgi:hypothetical protein
MRGVKLIGDLLGALLVARAKDVTGNFIGITFYVPFHKNPPSWVYASV